MERPAALRDQGGRHRVGATAGRYFTIKRTREMGIRPTNDELDQRLKAVLSGMSVEGRVKLLMRAADIHKASLIMRAAKYRWVTRENRKRLDRERKRRDAE